MTEDFNDLTKKELIEKCKIAEENYSKLFRENIKLTMFYNGVMNNIYKQTRILSDIPVQYKVVEDEKFIEMLGGIKPFESF
jgi:hypothetical protein